jgi:hypothetical protein
MLRSARLYSGSIRSIPSQIKRHNGPPESDPHSEQPGHREGLGCDTPRSLGADSDGQPHQNLQTTR